MLDIIVSLVTIVGGMFIGHRIVLVTYGKWNMWVSYAVVLAAAIGYGFAVSGVAAVIKMLIK